MVETYKANRDAAPDILRQQMGLVRQVVDLLALPVVSQAGFEADDIIATLTERAVAEGDDVIIVTGDRDSYQLVSDPHVKVLYNKRGVSEYALYDEAGHRGAHRASLRRSTCSTRRCGAIRPTTCRASRASGRRPRPSWSTPTATSTASSPTSTNRHPSSART